MILNRTYLSALAAFAIGLGSNAGIASAQEAAPEAAPAPVETQAVPAPQVSEAKLKSFAVAFLEVSKITQAYQPQIQSAGSEEDMQRIRQEAGAEMMQAVDQSGGISVDEYNTIIQAAQIDPDLAQRINGHITEVAQEQTPAAAPAPEQPAAE